MSDISGGCCDPTYVLPGLPNTPRARQGHARGPRHRFAPLRTDRGAARSRRAPPPLRTASRLNRACLFRSRSGAWTWRSATGPLPCHLRNPSTVYVLIGVTRLGRTPDSGCCPIRRSVRLSPVLAKNHRATYRAGDLWSLCLKARAVGKERTARSHHENTGNAAPEIGVGPPPTALSVNDETSCEKLQNVAADSAAVSVEHALVRSGELAHDLAYEGLVWMRRGADDRDASRVQLDHKQRVVRDQAADGPDLRGEEVRGQHCVPMRPQEGLPRGGSLAARRDPLRLEDRGDGGPCHVMIQILQRALDARVNCGNRLYLKPCARRFALERRTTDCASRPRFMGDSACAQVEVGASRGLRRAPVLTFTGSWRRPS